MHTSSSSLVIVIIIYYLSKIKKGLYKRLIFMNYFQDKQYILRYLYSEFDKFEKYSYIRLIIETVSVKSLR